MHKNAETHGKVILFVIAECKCVKILMKYKIHCLLDNFEMHILLNMAQKSFNKQIL